MLDIEGGFGLIGRVLKDEAGLQFMLQRAVRRIGKAGLLFAGSVETDKVSSDVFDFVLGAFAQSFPSTTTQFGDSRRSTIFAFVFGYTVQVVDRNEDGVAATEDEFDHFLRFAIHLGSH